ncbi:MATE family efflux transporter [Pseudalkalibacillus salsuginis]|uniref:MATE family efflux transporter n=1 Tax=Pseudalkalibacillus salsuginis TaxID=2910972 RepID=UPI001EFF3643|nr:MATE family efflux transporter [Pseudalkalibacillus salsuginis]MCF6409625.1 hypothetical protein [Pseudalkalibacillus salsuginis]
MSGSYDTSALACVSIRSYIWSPVFTGLSGILLAVSPIAAQLLGEKMNREISSVVMHGIYQAFIIGG